MDQPPHQTDLCPECGQARPGSAAVTGAACPTCGQALWNAPRGPVAYGEWGGGSNRTFKILLVAPLAGALAAATCRYWGLELGMVVFGIGNLVVGLVSSIYCGAWLAGRLASGAFGLFVLRLGLPLLLLAVNAMIIAVGCGALR